MNEDVYTESSNVKSLDLNWWGSDDNPTDLGLSNYEKAVELMHSLHDSFRYVPLSTNINTTAEEAFVQGQGVCQDYAHIFIALLHLAKIPSRYVTGKV